MQKTLILLAGYPATGKTYLADLICEKFNNVVKISPDDIKVDLWKTIGFKNLVEKDAIYDLSWLHYYDQLDKLMANKHNIVTEYPFSEKQKHQLDDLSKQYDFDVITIRLTADFEELWSRHLKRDLEGGRDLVYNVPSYDPLHPPTRLGDDHDVITKEIFRDRYDNKGYGTFTLGTLYEVDTTNFGLVNYDKLLEEIDSI